MIRGFDIRDIPERDVLTVGGIDPGTDTLGGAILEYDFITRLTTVRAALTFHASRTVSERGAESLCHGYRYARIYSHGEAISHLITAFNPHLMASEAPFLGKAPQAFAALVECVMGVKAVIARDHPHYRLDMVDPPSAKAAVGAPPHTKDKEMVRKAVIALGLVYDPSVDINTIEEHAVDAIAVAYWRLQRALGRREKR